MSNIIKGITCKSNLVSKEAFLDHVTEVLRISADAVRKSFGPHGTHSFYNTGVGRLSEYTKDGVTILNQISFEGELENTMFRYLLEASLEINQSVGDGTTSAFLATERLFNRMKTLIETDTIFKDVRPHQIVMTINVLVENIVAKLKSNSVDTTEMSNEQLSEVIYNIAKISLNNDEIRAKYIVEAYSRHGIDTDIVIEPSPDNSTIYEESNGRCLDYGYIDPMFMNDKTDNTYKAEKCKVLIFNGVPNNKEHEEVINLIIKDFIVNNRSLTIICKDLSHRVKSLLQRFMTALNNQGTKNVLNILAIPTDSKLGVGRISDLGLLTGAVPVNVETSYLPGYEHLQNEEYYSIPVEERIKKGYETIVDTMLGEADIVSHSDRTIFRNCKGEESEYFKTRKLELEIELDKLSKRSDRNIKMDIDVVKARLNIMKPSVVRLLVGGESEVAKRASMDLYDDAIKAVRSAIKNGYTAGGNMSVPIAVKELIEEIKTNTLEEDLGAKISIKLLTEISEAFSDLYRYILTNSGLDEESAECYVKASINTKGKVLLDVVAMEQSSWIVNPVQTDITIARTVLQLVANLLTSNQYICSCTDNNYYTEAHFGAC